MLGQIHTWQPFCGRVFDSLLVFVRTLFVFHFCSYYCAKAEISWLGTIRGDSECNACVCVCVRVGFSTLQICPLKTIVRCLAEPFQST